jgi:hypothetical protein
MSPHDHPLDPPRALDGPGAAALERRLVWLLALSAVALYLALCWPMFGGRVYLNNDLLHQFLPMRAFYAGTLETGDAPYWWPNLFGGFYLHGEGQGDFFHPLIWLLYRTLPVTGAFALETVLWYPVAYAGFYLLLGRRLGFGPVATLAGALLTAFSIFTLHRLVHPNALGIIAHTPWLMLAADVCCARASSRTQRLVGAVGFAALVGSSLLLGYPQYLFYAMLLVGALLVFRLVRKELAPEGLLWLGGALALGVALGAVQLLPTQAALAQSVRARPDLWDPSHAFDGSTDPRHLMSAVSAYSLPVSHKQRIYAGAVTLCLAIVAFLRIGKGHPHRGLVLGLGALALVSIWLATGKYGGLYALQTKLPFIDKFRFPSRYFLVTHLALGGLGALALADLARRQTVTAWKRLWPLALVAIAALGVTALAFARKGQTSTEMPAAVVLGGAAVVVACVLVALAARGAAWALLALLPLHVADAAGYGVAYHRTNRLGDELAAMPQPPGPLTAERVAAGRNDALTLLGWHVLDGVAGLDPVKRLDYRAREALSVAGVRWVVPDAIDASDRFYDYYEVDTTGLTEVRPGVFELPDPMPRARLVPRAGTHKDPAVGIVGLPVRELALVDWPLELGGGEPGQATVTMDRPGKIRLDTSAPGAQLAVLTESFDPGWRATIDGQPATPIPAYGDLLAVPVPAGDHRVAFDYLPPRLAAGKKVSLAGLGVLLAAAFAAAGLTLRARVRAHRSLP